MWGSPRKTLASDIEQTGQRINELREEALRNNYPYTAGLLRAAEEALLAAMNGLKDANVPEREL